MHLQPAGYSNEDHPLGAFEFPADQHPDERGIKVIRVNLPVPGDALRKTMVRRSELEAYILAKCCYFITMIMRFNVQPINRQFDFHSVNSFNGSPKRPILCHIEDYSNAFALATTFSTVKPNSSNNSSAGADSPKVVIPTMAPFRPTYLNQ